MRRCASCAPVARGSWCRRHSTVAACRCSTRAIAAWRAALAKQTIEALEAVQADYVVSGAASCAIAIMHDYARLLRDEPAWAERAERLGGAHAGPPVVRRSRRGPASAARSSWRRGDLPQLLPEHERARHRRRRAALVASGWGGAGRPGRDGRVLWLWRRLVDRSSRGCAGDCAAQARQPAADGRGGPGDGQPRLHPPPARRRRRRRPVAPGQTCGRAVGGASQLPGSQRRTGSPAPRSSLSPVHPRQLAELGAHSSRGARCHPEPARELALLSVGSPSSECVVFGESPRRSLPSSEAKGSECVRSPITQQGNRPFSHTQGTPWLRLSWFGRSNHHLPRRGRAR